MPQLPADVPVQGKFGPKESCCRSTCKDCFGRCFLLKSESLRFSSLVLQKSPLTLPLGHDLDTMSDSTLWTALSNFNVPHFLSGARLRRSKRYQSGGMSYLFFCFMGWWFAGWRFAGWRFAGWLIYKVIGKGFYLSWPKSLFFLQSGNLSLWTVIGGRDVFFVLTWGQVNSLVNKKLGVPILPIVYYLLCESSGNWMFAVELLFMLCYTGCALSCMPSLLINCCKVETLMFFFVLFFFIVLLGTDFCFWCYSPQL